MTRRAANAVPKPSTFAHDAGAVCGNGARKKRGPTPAPLWTDAEYNALAELWLAGWTDEQIGARFGITAYHSRTIRGRLGLPHRPEVMLALKAQANAEAGAC